jgi:Na+-transporting methylmalonyl-CoA/oxaloacetate decarboxylase gamma subunit
MIDALWITLIGMGITFAAIILLWWMMAALTALPFKDEDESEADEPIEPVAEGQTLKAKAAAIAVAVALAEQELSSARPLPPPPTAIVSAWQLSTRTRQLSEKGKQRRK